MRPSRRSPRGTTPSAHGSWPSARGPTPRLEARRLGVPVLDVVIPVYNEQAALAGSVRRLHRYLRDTFPYPVRITIADNASVDDTPRIAAELADELDDVRVVRLEQKGRGRALHQVWSQSDAMVLAYMDVDLSTDLAARRTAGRTAHLGSLRPVDRHPAGPRLPRRAGPQAGVHLALLQPDPALDAAGPLLRRPVWVQGDSRRRRPPAAAARRRHRLVLRHRTAGARRTQRPAHSRGAGRLGRRPRQPGRHHRDGHRRPQGRRPAAARLRQWLDPRECHCRATGSVAIGGRRTQLAVPPGGALRRHRRRLDRGLPAAVHGAAPRDRRPGRELRRPAVDRDREHRRQPALHVRSLRRDEGGAPSRRGPHRLRHRAGDHQRCAGRPACLRRRSRTACSRSPSWWRPTCSPPPFDSSSCAAGCFTPAEPTDTHREQGHDCDTDC